jgi:hypothetical protein
VGEALAYLVTSFASYGRTQLVRGVFARLSQAVVIFAVYRRLRGERPSFRASLRGGLGRFWPVLRVALALLVIELGLTFVLWLPYQLAWMLASDYPTFTDEYAFYAGYGIHAIFLLLLTPFWIAVPAAVVDRTGSFLARSWRLTRGNRLRIFVVVLFLTAWQYVRYYLVWPATYGLALPASHAIGWAQELLLTSLGAVLAVVGYRALRLHKEGLDVTTLEEIFD